MLQIEELVQQEVLFETHAISHPTKVVNQAGLKECRNVRKRLDQIALSIFSEEEAYLEQLAQTDEHLTIGELKRLLTAELARKEAAGEEDRSLPIGIYNFCLDIEDTIQVRARYITGVRVENMLEEVIDTLKTYRDGYDPRKLPLYGKVYVKGWEDARTSLTRELLTTILTGGYEVLAYYRGDTAPISLELAKGIMTQDAKIILRPVEITPDGCDPIGYIPPFKQTEGVV